jgi:hypothetical protein
VGRVLLYVITCTCFSLGIPSVSYMTALVMMHSTWDVDVWKDERTGR